MKPLMDRERPFRIQGLMIWVVIPISIWSDGKMVSKFIHHSHLPKVITKAGIIIKSLAVPLVRVAKQIHLLICRRENTLAIVVFLPPQMTVLVTHFFHM